MSYVHNALLFLHLLAAIAWLGGMFFAHFCLRPAAVKVLAPADRLPLMCAALELFLRYTAISVFVVVTTGLALFWSAGFAGAPVGWYVMLGLGVVMAAVYAYVHSVQLPALRSRCESKSWPEAAAVLGRIRQFVATNLCLGVLVIAAAASSR